MNSNVKQNSSSTLEGSVLILTCENEISSIMNMNVTNEEILSVTCHSSGNWIPDPAQFTCSGSEILIHSNIKVTKYILTTFYTCKKLIDIVRIGKH